MMEFVGTVKALWRYPVKSMVGESCDSVAIENFGVLGDRLWTVRDETIGEISVVRKNPKLLQCSARYESAPNIDETPAVEITFPTGAVSSSASKDTEAMLSELLAKPVTLWPLQAKRNWQHYRLAGIAGAKEMKRLFANKEIPDFSSISWMKIFELMLFATPLGRYYDVYPLHVLSTNSLAKMAELEPEGDFDVRRFRPNIVIENAGKEVGFDEFTWLGGTLTIGTTIIKCQSRTIRCSAPSQPQAGMEKSAKVMRGLDKHTDRYMGINATVLQAGSINVGDEVHWQPAQQGKLAKTMAGMSAKAKNLLVHSSSRFVDLFKK